MGTLFSSYASNVAETSTISATKSAAQEVSTHNHFHSSSTADKLVEMSDSTEKINAEPPSSVVSLKRKNSSIKPESIMVTHEIITKDHESLTEQLQTDLTNTCDLGDGFISQITEGGGWNFLVIQRVVEQDGKTIISGIAFAEKYTTRNINMDIKKTGVHLLALCVSIQFQNRGLGKKLLKYFEAHCLEINAREVFAYSVGDKIGWYSALGYKFCKPDVLILGDTKCLPYKVVQKIQNYLDREKRPDLTNQTAEGVEIMLILNKSGYVQQDSSRTIMSRFEHGVLMTKELIPVTIARVLQRFHGSGKYSVNAFLL